MSGTQTGIPGFQRTFLECLFPFRFKVDFDDQNQWEYCPQSKTWVRIAMLFNKNLKSWHQSFNSALLCQVMNVLFKTFLRIWFDYKIHQGKVKVKSRPHLWDDWLLIRPLVFLSGTTYKVRYYSWFSRAVEEMVGEKTKHALKRKRKLVFAFLLSDIKEGTIWTLSTDRKWT